MTTCILIISSICLLHFEKGTKQATARFIINIINSFIVLVSNVSYEIRELMSSGLDYFKESSKITECIFLVTFAGAIITDMMFGTDYKQMDAEPKKELCRIFYAFLTIFSFLKLLFLMRIFNNISFIVKMLRRVTEELIPFIILFLSFIIVFSLTLMTLGFDLKGLENNPYDGIY